MTRPPADRLELLILQLDKLPPDQVADRLGLEIVELGGRMQLSIEHCELEVHGITGTGATLADAAVDWCRQLSAQSAEAAE